MPNFIDKTLEEFDEEFKEVYYGKDNDGQPIYPTLEMCEAFKSFLLSRISQSVSQARDELKKEILRKLPETKPQVHDKTHTDKGVCLNCWNDVGYNQAINEIRKIISKL